MVLLQDIFTHKVRVILYEYFNIFWCIILLYIFKKKGVFHLKTNNLVISVMIIYILFYSWFSYDFPIYGKIFVLEKLTLFSVAFGALIPDINPKSIFDKLEYNGFTHTLPMFLVVIISPLILGSPIKVCIAVGFGFMVHLIIDTLFSPLGVKWFYPIWNRSLGFKLIKRKKLSL